MLLLIAQITRALTRNVAAPVMVTLIMLGLTALSRSSGSFRRWKATGLPRAARSTPRIAAIQTVRASTSCTAGQPSRRRRAAGRSRAGVYWLRIMGLRVPGDRGFAANVEPDEEARVRWYDQRLA